MKLLIMEDEVQIREGLSEGLDWEQFGIDEIYTAKNGEVGLELAKRCKLDIILTDIRMPRMDGIQAVKRLRKYLPKCSIIFISAYSEKHYLKEAIRLKAVSFVEKPIDMEELKKVIEEAILEQRENRDQKEQEKKALLYNAQILAGRLNRNLFRDREECRKELKQVGIEEKEYRLFATVLVHYAKGPDREEEARWNLFCLQNEHLCASAPVRLIFGQKQADLLVYHLFLKRENQYMELLDWLSDSLREIRRYYILAGSLQNSVMRFQDSYNDAALLLNRAFYLPYGKVVTGEERDVLMTLDFGGWKADFAEKLMRGCFAEAEEALEDYKGQILKNQKVHFSIVKEFYLYLYGELRRYAEKNSLFLKESLLMETQELFLRNGNFEELHESIHKLLQMTAEAGNEGEDGMIVRIKKYVSQNYENPWLSIKEIADAMGKSVSNICVVFKRETGITLNQFLTDVRIDAAKTLLDNPRNSIKTVAEKSGYTDSSYFTRIFKKHTGMTPSEYRGEVK